MEVYKMTKKEINELKKEVKKATGRNMKDIEIEAWGDDFISYCFYRTNYDRVTNNQSHETIKRG